MAEEKEELKVTRMVTDHDGVFDVCMPSRRDCCSFGFSLVSCENGRKVNRSKNLNQTGR